jgi:hypothetical protein
MRSILAAILTFAVTVTGVLVAIDLTQALDSGSSIAAPEAPGAVSPDDLRLIQQFYDAANSLLAGDDSRALTAVVSPRIEVHLTNEDPVGGLDAVARRLVALQRQGDLRLSVSAVSHVDQEIAALVEAHTIARAGGAPAATEDDLLWQTIDRFRLEGGMIAEYWPGAISSRPLLPPPPFTVPRPAQDATLALARLEFAPDATVRPLTIPASQLYLVENGTLFVSSSQSLAIARVGNTQFTWLAAAEPVGLPLGPGDALLVPAEAASKLTNRGDQPASILSVFIAPSNVFFGPKHDLSPDMLTAVAMHDPARLGRRTAWASGVTSEPLAVSRLPRARSQAAAVPISGRTRSLEPGEQIEPPTEPGLTLGIVSSGTLHVEIAPAPGSATATPLASDDAAIGTGILRAGDAFAIAPESRYALTNVGAAQVDLTLIEAREASGVASPAPR